MGLSENNRKAKFYRRTAAVRRQLRHEVSSWEAVRCGGGQGARSDPASCSRGDSMKPTLLWRCHARFFGPHPDPGAEGKDELRFHSEAKIDGLVARGWPPKVARQDAKPRFGELSELERIGARREDGTPRTLQGFVERQARGRVLHSPHAWPRPGLREYGTRTEQGTVRQPAICFNSYSVRRFKARAAEIPWPGDGIPILSTPNGERRANLSLRPEMPVWSLLAAPQLSSVPRQARKTTDRVA
jgi:hypothetical protein